MTTAPQQDIIWRAFPQQDLAFNRPEFELLYGGAKMGGKTDLLLAWSIARRIKYPRSRGGFIRREIAELTKQGAAWDRAQRMLGPRARYNQTEHTITFANGSVLEFGHCKDEESKTKYQGAQYDDLCFDQLEQFTESMYAYIKGACRTAESVEAPVDEDGNRIQPKIRCSANPGDIGHSWVKAYFVDVARPGEPYVTRQTIERPDGTQLVVERSRIFIPSLVFDNPYAGDEYAATLDSMPEPYRSAYLFGRWDVFIGQAFADFHPILEGKPHHVIPYRELPKASDRGQWRRVAFHDWGYAAPSYSIWGALDPAGGIIWYRELSGRHWDPAEVYTQTMLAQGGEKVEWWADPSIWGKDKSRLTEKQIEALDAAGLLQLSIADQYEALGWGLKPAINDRLAGKMAIHRLLTARPDGVPYMRFMTSCPEAIACFQQIQLDPKKKEDVVTEYPADAPIRDEPYDCVRYGAMAISDLALSPPKLDTALVLPRRYKF